jgi:hypothetical protein
MTYSGGVENSKINTIPNSPAIIQKKGDRQDGSDNCFDILGTHAKGLGTVGRRGNS